MSRRRECTGPCGLCRRASAAGAHIRAELVAGILFDRGLEGAKDWDCPFGMGPVTTTGASRGLGDTVAKITRAVGIQPCGGCKERQAALNALVPYKSDNLQPPLGS